MMNLPYLYESNSQFDSKKILVILPDIFGLNNANIKMTDDLSILTGYKTYCLDYFFKITDKKTDLDFINGVETAVELMHQMTGDNFIEIFNDSINTIFNSNPHIDKIAVCGFCFGGRLALLSSINPNISKIVSFYGSGALLPNFYKNQSIVQILKSNREVLKTKEFLCYYGQLDQSITETDRLTVSDVLEQSAKDYKEIIYQNAGHAFFSKERVNFVSSVYDDARHNLKLFLD